MALRSVSDFAVCRCLSLSTNRASRARMYAWNRHEIHREVSPGNCEMTGFKYMLLHSEWWDRTCVRLANEYITKKHCVWLATPSQISKLHHSFRNRSLQFITLEPECKTFFTRCDQVEVDRCTYNRQMWRDSSLCFMADGGKKKKSEIVYWHSLPGLGVAPRRTGVACCQTSAWAEKTPLRQAGCALGLWRAACGKIGKTS